MPNAKEIVIDTVAELGGSSTGAVAGAAIGASVLGPWGIVGGALAGTLIEKGFLWIGNEIKTRTLSPREAKRIDAVSTYASHKIHKNLASGKTFRADCFLESSNGERSVYDEILEGVVLVAQKEYEEKKLRYLGNLYGNLPFDTMVDPRMANMLLKIASELTYRQYVILFVIDLYQNPVYEAQIKKEPYESLAGFKNMTIATEIFDLYRRTLIHSSDALLDAAAINPSTLELVGYGSLMFKLMELDEIKGDPICFEIMDFMTGTIHESSEQQMTQGTLNSGIDIIEFDKRIDSLQEEVDSIPRLNISTKSNEGGGQTLIIDGGNASGSKEFIETEYVINQLEKL